MVELTCPKCRRDIPDAALDAGNCPGCGFPLDGPVVLNVSRSAGNRGWVFAVVGVLVLGGAVLAYREFREPGGSPSSSGTDVALNTPEPSPNLDQPRKPIRPEIAPEPRLVQIVPPKPEPPKPEPPNPEPPKPEPPKPDPPKIDPPLAEPPKPGRVLVLDPRDEPTRKLERKLDLPAGTALIPDLNHEDRVVLTGKVKVLKIGSVSGRASIDASALVADTIVLSGDLNSDAVVKLNAPDGRVTIGGQLVGNAKLTVHAPAGEVQLGKTGKLDGGCTVEVTAKRVEVNAPMLGGAKLLATLTTGGSLKLGVLDGGATVTYKRAAATDPPVKVQMGELRGGAKVTGE